MIPIIKLETAYHRFLKSLFWAINPFKKIIVRTECQVHTHINQHALIILKNDRYQDAYDFYLKFIDTINEGAVWADQDFKSSNHFYNPYKKKEVCTAGATRWRLQSITT